jgi:hypothetical protein
MRRSPRQLRDWQEEAPTPAAQPRRSSEKMLANQGQASEVDCAAGLVRSLLRNTAAASSSTTYVDVRKYEGDLVITINPGAITGSCTPDIQDATDTTGTATASVAANEGAYTALVANTVRKYTMQAGATRGFIRESSTRS